jgi:hypothetical protein
LPGALRSGLYSEGGEARNDRQKAKISQMLSAFSTELRLPCEARVLKTHDILRRSSTRAEQLSSARRH